MNKKAFSCTNHTRNFSLSLIDLIDRINEDANFEITVNKINIIELLNELMETYEIEFTDFIKDDLDIISENNNILSLYEDLD